MPPSSTVLRVAPQLRLFLSARQRAERVSVPCDGTATIGHVAESVGIPLTEIGQFRVHGRCVDPTERAVPGSTIDVLAVVRPQVVAERFVLDVHLGKLARRLRLLGVDSSYRNDATDDALIDTANTCHRVLLTRDRSLLCRRALWCGAYVYSGHPREQVSDVLTRFGPHLAPWSRCTRCNAPLTQVSKQDVAAKLWPGTQRTHDQYARCLHCGTVYWRGAHAPRIEQYIAEARAVHPDPTQRSNG